MVVERPVHLRSRLFAPNALWERPKSCLRRSWRGHGGRCVPNSSQKMAGPGEGSANGIGLFMREFRIQAVGAQGDGIAEGSFVPLTLPGELITAEMTGNRGELV